MAKISNLTMDVRIYIQGKNLPLWRVRAVKWFARLLGIPLNYVGTAK